MYNQDGVIFSLYYRTNKMKCDQERPLTTKTSIIVQQSKEEFFSFKKQIKRYKSPKNKLTQSQQFPKTQSSSTLSPISDIKSRNSQKLHQISLISTVGSEDKLMFRNKQPKRKRKRNRKPQQGISNILLEQSQSQCDSIFNSRIADFQKIKRISCESTKKFSVKDFIFLQLIGSGTYSDVYKVMEKKTSTFYSLKVMEKEKIRSMKCEINIIRQIKIMHFLDHPNITKLYGCFDDESFIYLICELAVHKNIYDCLMDNNNQKLGFSIKETSIMVSQICSAVEFMHKNFILHRDMKPENILLTFGNTIKLCDFGWSLYNPQQNLRSTICGTPLYLAPQLISQNEYNEAVDIWAIGVMTYELLTSEIPFKIKNIKDLVKIVHEEINYGIIKNPLAVDFIKRAMKRKAEDRITIQELCQHHFIKDYEDHSIFYFSL